MTQSSVLERDIADTTPRPVEPPTVTLPSRTGFSRGMRTWRNRAIVLIMIAATAFGSAQLIHHQSTRKTTLNVADVVLTSHPIDVNILQAGVVASVAVRAGDSITAGQPVGTVDVTTTNAKGRAVVVRRTLRAPSNGVVVTDPVSVGSTLTPGISFLELYNPSDLEFVTTVPLSDLPKISPGMSAELKTPGVSGSIAATLQRAVPRVGSNAIAVPKNSVQLILVAKREAAVARLIPGLRFAGYIDTRTAPKGTSRAQYVGSR